MTAYDPAADGWRTLPAAALPSGIGIPWARRVDGIWHYGLLTDDDHGNPNGVVHGGVMMAFADHGLSMIAWEAAERVPCTTIQLNTHFLDAIHPGEFIELRAEVTRRTRGLVFVRGVIGVRSHDAERDVGAVDGIGAFCVPVDLSQSQPVAYLSLCNQEGRIMDIISDPPRGRSPLTLAIDIGGSHLKAGLLDPDGTMVAGPNRVSTPLVPSPDIVVEALVDLATPLGHFDRVSIGFPGVVRQGQVLTAPNLGTPAWRHFPLTSALTDKFGKPARMLNDAEVQGLGVISGKGLECVITLGTGMGFALFQDGRPAPHLELSQHPIHKGKTYDQFIGAAALKDVGRPRWNRRLRRVLAAITTLVGFDTLLIGGGNAKYVDIELAQNIRLVGNAGGITGGVKLWDKTLDTVFMAGA